MKGKPVDLIHVLAPPVLKGEAREGQRAGSGCGPVPGTGRGRAGPAVTLPSGPAVTLPSGPAVTLPSGTHTLTDALSPLADFGGLQMFSLQPGQRERSGSVSIGSAVNHRDGFLRRASSQGHKHLASGQCDIHGAPRPSPPARRLYPIQLTLNS